LLIIADIDGDANEERAFIGGELALAGIAEGAETEFADEELGTAPRLPKLELFKAAAAAEAAAVEPVFAVPFDPEVPVEGMAVCKS